MTPSTTDTKSDTVGSAVGTAADTAKDVIDKTSSWISQAGDNGVSRRVDSMSETAKGALDVAA